VLDGFVICLELALDHLVQVDEVENTQWFVGFGNEHALFCQRDAL